MNEPMSAETLGLCRDHLESLQNLRYLIQLQAEKPQQVKLHLREMESHLNRLGANIFGDSDTPAK